jgi:hypothetical protein
MSNRRPLTEGINPPAAVDSRIEKDFVFGGKAASDMKPHANKTKSQGRMPVSTKLRTDIANALKRASLERQLADISPNTVQDILEEAVEPWLKANGYLE